MFYLIDYFWKFLIGICIGSFLNVVIFRLPNEISILKPRSFCPKCKNKIKWYLNIPLLSWIILKAKCNYCSSKISARYPLVELINGILFVIFSSADPYFYDFNLINSFEKLFSWILLSMLIAISLIDFDHFWIPQSLINFGFLTGIFNLILIEFYKNYSFINSIFLKGILGALVAYLIFEFLRFFSKFVFKKDALGKGDSKLVAMLGLWLGPIGILLGIGMSYVVASIYLLIGFKIKKIKKGQLIPFAPFLSVGGLIVWYFGNETLLKVIYRQ
mgnify:CR=1 FL=1